MIRAFYSGTAGMQAQQTALDIIANNIANVNTNGFKQKEAEFTDLLYTAMLPATPPAMTTDLAGSGTAVMEAANGMADGNFQQTGASTDFAIPGDGFFALADANGALSYTRDGSFNALRAADGNWYLASASGMFVLDANGNRIPVTNDVPQAQPGVYVFANSPGLSNNGDNTYSATALSGPAAADLAAAPKQGFLESSNVDLARQMTDMVETQRSYQFGSRVVQTADQIADMVNNLNG